MKRTADVRHDSSDFLVKLLVATAAVVLAPVFAVFASTMVAARIGGTVGQALGLVAMPVAFFAMLLGGIYYVGGWPWARRGITVLRYVARITALVLAKLGSWSIRVGAKAVTALHSRLLTVSRR